jgi:hypothetical protein
MRDISECDEWQDPPPEPGTYWKDRHGAVCRVEEYYRDTHEVVITCLSNGEEFCEIGAVFSAVYHPVSDEELPLHLLGAV